MAAGRKPQTALAVELEPSLGLIDDVTGGAGIPAAARAVARAHASTYFQACGATTEAAAFVSLAYAAELLAAIAVDLAADPALSARLITQLERRAGIAAIALGRELLQAGSLLELPAPMGLEIRLALLRAFLGARTIGLWQAGASGEAPAAISHAGEMDADGREQELAAATLLSAEEAAVTDGASIGVRIERLKPPPAALVASGTDLDPVRAPLLLSVAGPVLSALLDGDGAPGRDSTEDRVVGAVERRLARLRFDLHDGPQQDVHLLAQDLALFREQVRPMIAADPNAARLLGRLDDLEAQLVALDGDLRRLSSAVQSPFLTPGSLPEALRALTDAFAGRTGVQPQVEIAGPLGELTDSQQITLLALIREALSNIRKHAGASAVSIRIRAGSGGIEAEIRDDGTGFEPEEMLTRAARAGRLGLVGMHERVRMLGGRTEIDSRPGGPTVISAFVPPWPRPE